MDARVAALRAQDVYSGLRTVDQTSGLIAAELEATRLTGMAATVAANIKGIDLIKDAKTLAVIAAQQWGIDSFALPTVLEVLQEVGYVTLHKDARGKVSQLDEHIPLLHDDVYDRLGQHFEGNAPSELDIAAVDSLEELATAPMRLSEVHARYGDPETVDRLLRVGETAHFARRFALSDGEEVVWSPFCAYEKPEALDVLFGSFERHEIREQFARVKGYQGLPVDGKAAVLGEAVGHGILLANSIRGSGGKASFAFLPYQAGAAHRRMEKIVLEKALILLACVRYGQHYAHYVIRAPAAILRKLHDGVALTATTEAASQYRTAAQAQIVRLESAGGKFFRAQLVETPDNLAATALALDLLEHGEPVTAREDPDQKLLFTGGEYLTPLMTMKDHPAQARLDDDVVLSIMDTFRGERGG